jgi:uncharacterized membrane protein
MATIGSAFRWGIDRRIFPAVAASALAVAVLIAGPIVLGARPTHRFLLWNLALAWIPFVAALSLEAIDAGWKTTKRPFLLLAAAATWLFFLPNAPYLVSDLTHFDGDSSTPWLDLTRLVSFAWAGCLLAVLSLRIVHRVAERRIGVVGAWSAVVLAAIGSGFGVVLGRFSRLNSWQVVTAPRSVLDEVVLLRHDGRSVAVALFFGLLLLTIYAAIGTPTRPRPRGFI